MTDHITPLDRDLGSMELEALRDLHDYLVQEMILPSVLAAVRNEISVRVMIEARHNETVRAWTARR